MADSLDTPFSNATIMLTGPETFNHFWTQLECAASLIGIWDMINPLVLLDSTPTRPARSPTVQEMIDRLNAQRIQESERANSDDSASSSGVTTRSGSTARSTPTPAKFEDIEREYNTLYREYQQKVSEWNQYNNQVSHVFAWLRKSVAPSVLSPAMTKATHDKDISLRSILRILREQLAPTATSTITSIRSNYKSVLKRAENRKGDQLKWYQEWQSAYQHARLENIPEVQGQIGVTEFLNAVSKSLAPEWGMRKLQEVIEKQHLGEPSLTLEEYAKMFYGLANEGRNRAGTKDPSIFATLGGMSDQQKSSGDSQTEGSSTGFGCPCLPSRRDTHKWDSKYCRQIEIALTGKGKIDENLAASIKRNLGYKFYNELRLHWERKLKIKIPVAKSTESSKSGKGASDQGALSSDSGNNNSPKYPGQVNAALIDPFLLEPAHEAQGLYATLDFSSHPLSNSTLLDNCGATHLVNSKELLVQGSFVKSGPDDYVESGTSRLEIVGRGKRVISNILNGAEGPKTENLVLHDVAVVEGFHVNIVSEARLRKAGIWYSGFDYTLRFGNEKESVVMAKLIPKYNLAFLEYKPLSNCMSIRDVIPTSAGGVLMFPTLERAVRQAYKKSKDYARPRSDSEARWHARSGHLGQTALRALVKHARSVIIDGTPRAKCEHCAVTHAAQVVSRRAPQRKAPRPFWRVNWDLFDFPLGYDGSNWLLMIIDEYSGKFFGFPLKTKSLPDVFRSIRYFEQWVNRQYGLSICKLKHDNETAVIAINGWSHYQRWAQEQGIDLELAPTYTHEPNGTAERAGREVIERSIKIRIAANLPENLWPETTLATIFLHAISPSEALSWRSPNEVLDSWFRSYFRWYDAALITRLTADLRPDWSGIYVYGARAYPLIKEREAGKSRRQFKVTPRGHIGYLVGYCASNIYKIWVPQLNEVIITRNVTFDEDVLYSPVREESEGQPIPITRAVVAQIEYEDEIQDAGSIIEHLWGGGPVPEDTIVVDVGDAQVPLSEVQESQNSGVRALPIDEHGLLTPEATPEPSRESDRRAAHTSEDTAQERRSGDDVIPTMQTNASGSLRPVGKVHLPQLIVRSKAPSDSDQAQDSRSTRKSTQNPPTRKYEHKTYPPAARSSKRLQKQAQERESQGSKGSSLGEGAFVTMSTMLGSTEDQVEDFFSTFWPDHPEVLGDAHQHRTVHAVVAATVLQNKTRRLGTAPSLPRIHQNDLPKAPKHWKDLASHAYGAQFEADAELEISNLEARNCWRQVPREEGMPAPIPLKWVFTYKSDSDGYLIRCRSRIVVRGDLQDEQTILTTYAATLAAKSFRVAMAIAARFDLEVKQFDVVNAFVNAERDKSGELVVCQLPDGFKKPGMCVVVDRALYGMRDSPALWFREFSSTLTKLGLIACKEEPCIYRSKEGIFIVFYVDDVQVLYHKSIETQAQELIQRLKGAYDLRDLGDIEWFLGIRVIRDRPAKKIWLVHDTYIEKIAKKFKLNGWKCPSTPLPGIELVKNEGSATPATIKLFQEKVGSALYTAIMIRPDVAFAVSSLSRFLTNPSSEHLSAIDWTIQYLFGTRFLALEYGGTSLEAQALMIATDASLADDIETRRSSHGYTISLFGGLILWKAARQNIVVTSTTHAELLGVEQVGKETMALQRFFKELQLDLGDCWTIFCDNKQTIRLIIDEQERVSTKLRHVDIQNMWLRQEHNKGTFQVTYLPTNEMPADGLTKNLPRFKFEYFRTLLNLQDIRGKLESLK
jgi:hypothetical protein